MASSKSLLFCALFAIVLILSTEVPTSYAGGFVNPGGHSRPHTPLRPSPSGGGGESCCQKCQQKPGLRQCKCCRKCEESPFQAACNCC